MGREVRVAAGVVAAQARGSGEGGADWRAGAACGVCAGVLAAAVAGGVWVFASTPMGGGEAAAAAAWGSVLAPVWAGRGAGGGCTPCGGRVPGGP